MKNTSCTVKVPQPPEGLTVREQARWWVRHPQEFQLALAFSGIPPEVLQECEIVGKDIDLAYKIIDAKKAPGLTKQERSRLFTLLTDGGVFDANPAKEGRKPKKKQALAAYDAMQEQGSVRESNQALRSAAGNTYHGNTSKLKKKAKLANEQRNRQEEMLANAITGMKAVVNEKAETEEESRYFAEVFTLFLQNLKEEAPDDFDDLMHSWYPPK